MKSCNNLPGLLTVAALVLGAAASQAQTQIIHPTTHSWKYLSTTADPGLVGWELPGFDDNSWASGTGLFGDETNYPYPVGTAIPGPADPGPITSYLRTRFTWNGGTVGMVLTGTNYIDDGDVIYLNGVEITRFNMPAGVPNYGTLSPAANPGGYPNVNAGEPVLVVMQIPLDNLTNGNANPLIQGENVLAVEIHNSAIDSSDTAFTLAMYGQQAVPPTFTTQPTNQTITACTTARLVAQATGIPNPTFSWAKDGTVIDPLVNATATSTTLVITNFQSTDAGNYQCLAANPSGSTPSAVATLSFVADTEPPFVATVANIDPSTVLLTFNEPIDPVSIDPFNTVVALVSDPAMQSSINGAVAVSGNPSQVLVTTIDPRILGQNYYVAMSGIKDLCNGNVIPSPGTSNQIPVSASFQEGASSYAGTLDTDVRANAAGTAQGNNAAALSDNDNPIAQALLRFENIFGATPGQVPFGATITSARLVFYTSNGSADRHGIYRMLVPWDESSTYDSLVTGVDQAGVEYFATPDAEFFNQNTVGAFQTNDVTASVAAWAEGANNYGWTIRPIGGTDGYQFATSEAADAAQRPVLIVDYVIIATPITITQQPQSVTADERQTVTFNVVATGSSPRFQWYKDTVLILGANGPSYTIPSVLPSDAGSYTVTVDNDVPSSATSAPATLTVNPDTTRPTVLSARGGPESSTTILVTFSEAMNQTAAQTLSNYELLGPGGLTIQSAGLNGNTVTLTLSSPRTPGQDYQLRVKDVTDTAFTPNVIDPNPTTLPVSTLFELVSINAHSWKYLQLTQWGAPPPCLDEIPWTLPAYDDGTWASGLGLFYGNRDGSQPATLDGSTVNTYLNVFTNGGNALQEITYYFRTTFSFPQASTAGASLLLHSMVDDGAVFYLNGTRVYDLRVTNNPASCTNFTAANAAGGQTWVPALANRGQIIGLAGLVTGPNTLAVELHQNNGTSSDVTLGVLLEAEVMSFGASAPSLGFAYDGAAHTLTLSWNAAGYVLEQADTVTGSWSLAGSTSPVTVSTATGTKFYRLHQP